MFTGIIENLATVERITKDQGNIHLTVKSNITKELKIDQSLAHNGVCLTVVNIENDTYTVTAIKETLLKTNLGDLIVGSQVNLERAMAANGRFASRNAGRKLAHFGGRWCILAGKQQIRGHWHAGSGWRLSRFIS